MGSTCQKCRHTSEVENFIREIVSSVKFNSWTLKDFYDLVEKLGGDLENLNSINDLTTSLIKPKLKLSDNTIMSLEALGNGRVSDKYHQEISKIKFKTQSEEALLKRLNRFTLRNFCSISSNCKWFMFHPEILPCFDHVHNIDQNYLTAIFAWIFPFLRPQNQKEKHKDLIELIIYLYGEVTRKNIESFLGQMIENFHYYLPKKIIKFTLTEYEIGVQTKVNGYSLDYDMESQLKALNSVIFTKSKSYEFLSRLTDKMSIFYSDPSLESSEATIAVQAIEDYLYAETILDNGFFLFSLSN